MLFNSYIFILVFLPITLLVFVLAQKYWSLRTGLICVILASLFYYAYWKIDYLAILVSSVLINYSVGWILMGRSLPRWTGKRLRNWIMPNRIAYTLTALGVIFNISILCYYKYAGFFTFNVNKIFACSWSIPDILLPIGISFFTFQQIAFIADAYAGKVRDQSFINYAFFLTFFPQLIAGPIVHHSEVMPQLTNLDKRNTLSDFGVGLGIFTIGLFKKVMIADTLAVYANAGYGVLDQGGDLSMASAWVTILAYSFQLYFDFSGYSDMAIGLGRLFGVKLPVNFYSPYKATGFIEFWRRWHITLSRFLRTYIYIPLGGNRNGTFRQLFNLLIVMFLGGLWHGSNWTFVVWGMLHGVMLVINHTWNLFKWSKSEFTSFFITKKVCALFTFGLVTLFWIPFRANNLTDAKRMFLLVFGFNNPDIYSWASIPEFFNVQFKTLSALWNITKYAPARELWPKDLPADYIANAKPVAIILLATAFVVVFFPNTCQLFSKFDPALGLEKMRQPHRLTVLKLGWRWAFILGLMLALSLLSMQRISPFLYFQF